jgi:hypothetical protein
MTNADRDRLIQAAEMIVTSIDKKIGYYSSCKPKIVEDWAGEGGVSICWDGPTDWTMNDKWTLHAELGLPMTEADHEEEPFYSVPKGFHAEPYNGSVLQVYVA